MLGLIMAKVNGWSSDAGGTTKNGSIREERYDRSRGECC